MTTITLEVPDELAAHLKIEPSHLPALIREAIEARLSRQSGLNHNLTAPLSQEIITFLTSNPSLEQVADFKISAPVQERLEELLDKNREEGLAQEENVEMEKYLRYRHVMILLKASTRRVLDQQP